MSKPGLSSLQLRILSASVLAPIAVAAVYFGGIYFTLFLGIAASVMSFEWCRASFKKNVSSYIALITIWILLTLYLAHEGFVLEAFLSLLICTVGVLSLTWFQKEEREWRGAFLGPVYVGIPIISLVYLRAVPEEGAALTASLFFIVWATDTGAYFAGRSIGGPKIAPSISPNKTWAGLIGGMLAAALVAVLSVHYLLNPELPLILVAIIGAFLAIVAQIGDFAESGWKRYFGIKDASNIIPGHGGVLDRLDGVLFVAPALYLLNILVGI
ncbi:MAG: phosphatidate cytidylyltransferase [Sneathiella sp.]|nr:phosphatidate cytidylyltransferase [Sneathiella sp.]